GSRQVSWARMINHESSLDCNYRHRERDLNLEAAILEIAGADFSVMQFYCPLRDCETEPYATGSALARCIHAIKRFEYFVQFRIRNARTVVAHKNSYVIGFALDADLNSSSGLRVTNSVSHNVFESAA